MSGLSALSLVLLAVASVLVLCASIASVRRAHPHHVHMLWYVFCLMLGAISLLFFYIFKNAPSIQSSALGGFPGTVAVFFIDASMDVRGELYILAGVVGLLILPQVLSYLISGLFGCGSPPVLV